MALAQDHLEAYAVCYQKAVDRLNRVIILSDYNSCKANPEGSSLLNMNIQLHTHIIKYPLHGYKSNCFVCYSTIRLQVRAWLRPSITELMLTIEDPTLQKILFEVLQTIMNNSAEPSRNVQHNNAQHAVLFEAIGLAIHLDPDSPLVTTAAVLLARFISSKETNVRYLGLDTMAHLASRADHLDAIKRHQGTIILSLRDKDISVRRRALDLLYSMCDVDNSEVIVGELLRYLKVADYGLREEMVLKIAILTEKYASTYKWYVDTILELISAAGDHVGDEVWYRVVQIVTNTEDLQAYAARVVFEYLKSPSSHESLVKVGGKLCVQARP
jgi:AP-2 complex subunit alpha